MSHDSEPTHRPANAPAPQATRVEQPDAATPSPTKLLARILVFLIGLPVLLTVLVKLYFD
jgi:hypothetical protein